MNIPKEEWQQDLVNTRKEIEAYDLLSRGFIILANLPENASHHFTFLSYAEKYAKDKFECEKFLIKLERLKEYYEES